MQVLEQLGSTLARTLGERRRLVLDRPTKTQAAVLVPLLAVGEEIHLLFTRRSASLPHHQGQVAFPGGARESADPDLVTTALREAQEEIGLDPAHVRVLGILDDLETVASRFVITPVVGIVPHPYDWQLCAREVDALFTVDVGVLAGGQVERRELWDFDGMQRPIDLYEVENHVIWGATHRITRNLLGLLPAVA